MDWKELFSDAYQPVLLVSGTLSGAKMWLDLRKARRESKPKDSQIEIATHDEVSRYGAALYGLFTALLIGGAVFPFFKPDSNSSQIAESENGMTRVGDPEARAKAAAHADASSGPPDLSVPSQQEINPAAADTFRKGYELYLSGNVPEGIRQMERADAMGAPGARARLCAIYRKPTAAEGKDFLKEGNKCKGID